MDMTFDRLYSFLEENKHELNFRRRNDVVGKMGTSQFCSLFCTHEAKDIPENVLTFLEGIFKVKKGYYDFMQIQKYEVGEYILPHQDAYPHFNLLVLSNSDVDGLTIEGDDGIYRFIPDKAGNFINLPRFKWHWVNPVRDKTRYTAVCAIKEISEQNIIDIIGDSEYL